MCIYGIVRCRRGGRAPDAAHVVAYLTDYEQRYGLDVRRPVRVGGVDRHPAGGLVVTTDHGDVRARAVVSLVGSPASNR